MDYNDFEPLFGKWAQKFKPFIESEKMDVIYKQLKEDAFFEKNGKLIRKEYIAPSSENVFRVFQESFPTDVKTIWYLADPYPRKYKNGSFQACGTAMDCRNSPDGKMQPSLELFYDAMEKDLDKKVDRSLSLKYLAEQGVLFLNTDLTCKLNKTSSHEGLWDSFQKYFLEEVMYGTTGIVYVLAGKVSHKMEKYINPLGNYIFKLDHPAAASHTHTDWDCKNIFTKTNRILHDNNNMKIFWDKKEWDEELNKTPF